MKRLFLAGAAGGGVEQVDLGHLEPVDPVSAVVLQEVVGPLCGRLHLALLPGFEELEVFVDVVIELELVLLTVGVVGVLEDCDLGLGVGDALVGEGLMDGGGHTVHVEPGLFGVYYHPLLLLQLDHLGTLALDGEGLHFAPEFVLEGLEGELLEGGGGDVQHLEDDAALVVLALPAGLEVLELLWEVPDAEEALEEVDDVLVGDGLAVDGVVDGVVDVDDAAGGQAELGLDQLGDGQEGDNAQEIRVGAEVVAVALETDEPAVGVAGGLDVDLGVALGRADSHLLGVEIEQDDPEQVLVQAVELVRARDALEGGLQGRLQLFGVDLEEQLVVLPGHPQREVAPQLLADEVHQHCLHRLYSKYNHIHVHRHLALAFLLVRATAGSASSYSCSLCLLIRMALLSTRLASSSSVSQLLREDILKCREIRG